MAGFKFWIIVSWQSFSCRDTEFGRPEGAGKAFLFGLHEFHVNFVLLLPLGFLGQDGCVLWPNKELTRDKYGLKLCQPRSMVLHVKSEYF